MITDSIIRAFIKGYRNTKDIQVRSQYGILEGWVSVGINFILFVVKLTAGLFVNSISLIADAIHSISDMFSSAAIIWGFKMSGVPPDRDHPFGHGRMEHVATLIIAILLLITGFEFLRVAFGRIRNPEPVIFNLTVIFIVFSTILVKEWLARFSRDLSRKIDSKALLGDSLHHRTDAISSLLVLLALFSEKIHFRQFDGIIGILLSIYIMYSGWRMLNDVISPLIGESASYEELVQIKSLAMSVEKVKGVHDMTMHRYGTVKIISLHVEMPEEIPFMKAHDVIEKVEELINARMNATTVIHLDPIQKMNSKLREVHLILEKILESNPKLDSYHDLRMIKAKKNYTLVLDIVASDNASPSQMKTLRKNVASKLKSHFPKYIIKIWVDPKFHASVSPKSDRLFK